MSAHPGNQGPAIVKVAIVSPIIAGLFVPLRIYTRAFLARALGLDDAIAALTLLSSIAYSILISNAAYNGMDRHKDDMSEDLMERYEKWIVISSELYLTTLLGYKLAILTTYHRIFSVSRRFKYVCWATMGVTTAYLVCNMTTEVTGCYPLRKFWNEKVSGHCVNFVALDITYGAFNVLTDFAIAILPLRTVWHLKMDRKDKIGLSLIFLTVIVAFAVALVRWIISCVDLTSHDRTWVAGLTFLWSILEVNTGLICACCLPLKPLLTHARSFTHVASLRKLSSGSGPPPKPTSNDAEKETSWFKVHRKSDGSDQQPVLDSVDREMRRLSNARG
ncbi:MAG: hypothetical protein Q9160_003033 [Pyrenula sp. 1 TL-2023]